MVFINHSTQQMAAKVVYYGPGLCGKTTNLQWIFDNTTPDNRGEMVSMATETDRTLFFDLLPIELGKIGDFDVRVQLYTVPGQVFYNSTRKLVLRGVDGIVFVADSQRDMAKANVDSLNNLEENLAEMDLTLDSVPLVLQYNKRDLANALTVDELNESLNRGNWPWVEAVAVNGTGVLETLKVVAKATLRHLRGAMGGQVPAAQDAQTGSQPAAEETPKPRRVPPRPPRTLPAPPETPTLDESVTQVEPPPATQVAPPPETQVAPPAAASHEPVEVALPVPELPDEPAAPSAAPERPVLRFSEALIHERLTVGKPCLLRFALKRQPSSRAGKEIGELAAAADVDIEATVEVLITPEDFGIADSASPHTHHQSMTLSGNADPEPILFKLHPRHVGRKRIKIDVLQNGRYVGGTSVYADVIKETPEAPLPVAAAYGVVTLEDAPAPDLTLLVTENEHNDNARSYRFTVHSPKNALAFHSLREELRIYGSPEKWLAGLHGELATLGPETDPTRATEILNTVSSDLYEKLFPRELKKLWQERLRGKVETISIISDEAWIPWEMVRPNHRDDSGGWVEDDFLCAEHSVGRWLAGATTTSRLQISKGAVIAPQGASEGQMISSLADVTAIEPQLMAVEHMVPHGGFDILHFNGEGSFEGDGGPWSLHLDGSERLHPDRLTAARTYYETERPFVFMNPRVGGDSSDAAPHGDARVGLAGWANTLMPAMAGAFLGGAWALDEDLAGRFARAFYGALRQGRPVGEAVRAARTELRAVPASTWLAYSLFGDPLARARFNRP